MKIFIIPGYGIPKNIFKDESYKAYFNFVGKKINEFVINHPKTKITIIFSGGPTDLEYPYKRTEAKEMFNFFDSLYQPLWGKYLKYRLEQKSLSSLENQVYSKQIIDKIKDKHKSIALFGEKTRTSRIKKTAKIIFSKISTIRVELPANKQVSDNKLIIKKENLVLKYSLWALKNNVNFNKYRKIFHKKFRYLRRFPIEKQDEAITVWWKKAIIDAKNLNEK